MHRIEELLQERILVIDGAMGTMIQRYGLEEKDYRGEPFSNWHKDVKGNNDLLCITRPDVIEAIHTQYLEAGADIIETNTFSAQRISMADYDMQDWCYTLNVEAARCARRAVLAYCQKHNISPTDRFVAGAIGPTNRTLSLSPDVNNPGFRAVTFDEVKEAYYEQIRGLVDGGSDLILIETIFDTLNAKAAIVAYLSYFDAHPDQPKLPLMISGTITDASGRTLSGQTLEAFYISVQHASPLSIGFNCALGATQMRPHIEELSQLATCYVSAYPNAGLPNAFGQYDEQPHETGHILADWAREGLVNIVGGCCGTTPDHIRCIADELNQIPPRRIQTK